MILEKDQNKILQEIYEQLSELENSSSNFLENSQIVGEKVNIIFRQYNNLYFVFVVDDNESELAMIDIIQVFGCYEGR